MGAESAARDARGRVLPFEPTDEQRERVRDLATAGVSAEQIAMCVKDVRGKSIGVATLYRHFNDEMTVGPMDANTMIAGRLFKEAMAGNVTAMIFWLKTRARWAETQKVELTGRDGKPLPSAPPSLIVQFGGEPEAGGEVDQAQQAQD